MVVEDVVEATDSDRDQTDDQTWGRPDRSECESIKKIRSVLYKSGGAALRTNCVGNADSQDTARLVHGRCTKWHLFWQGWRTASTLGRASYR